MTKQPNNILTKRVEAAANRVLYRDKILSYPELFVEMGILHKDKPPKLSVERKVVHIENSV